MPTVDLYHLTLADAFTATGAAGFAVLIVMVIALAKNLRGVGPWLDAGNEPVVVYVLAALVMLGGLAQGGLAAVTGDQILQAVIGWVVISQGAMVAHDLSPMVTGLVLTPSATPVAGVPSVPAKPAPPVPPA